MTNAITTEKNSILYPVSRHDAPAAHLKKTEINPQTPIRHFSPARIATVMRLNPGHAGLVTAK